MRLSEAGLEANIDYWKRVADRYRAQRDDALREVRSLQEELYKQTGKAFDGYDYLREIKRTQVKRGFFAQLLFLIRRKK